MIASNAFPLNTFSVLNPFDLKTPTKKASFCHGAFYCIDRLIKPEDFVPGIKGKNTLMRLPVKMG